MSDLSRKLLDHADVLTKEQERELFAAWKAGDKKARERIIVGALKFAYSFAYAHARRRPWALDDLVGASYEAVVEAFEDYDIERGMRFIGFAAFYIRKAVMRYIHAAHHAVNVGVNDDLRRASLWIRDEYGAGRTPSAEEITQQFGINAASASSMLMVTGKRLSMEHPIIARGGTGIVDKVTLREVIPSDCEPPEDAYADREMLARTVELLDCLNDRERYIVERHVMSDDRPTLDDIGKEYGVTRERVRQVEKEALRKMRVRARVVEKLGL